MPTSHDNGVVLRQGKAGGHVAIRHVASYPQSFVLRNGFGTDWLSISEAHHTWWCWLKDCRLLVHG
jgi:hypothetical protein